MSSEDLTPLVSRLETVTRRLEQYQLSNCGSNGNHHHSPGGEAMAQFVVEFDALLSGVLEEYMRQARAVGGDAALHADMVQRAFSAQRSFVLLASRCRKPTDSQVAALIKPQADIISQITQFREKNRRSPMYNHLSTISESIAALSWVVTSPAPAPLIKEMNDAGQFWGNRVIKDDKKHQPFSRAWSETLSALQLYVKQHHTTGLSWNARGGDAVQMAAGGLAAGGGGAAAPPPPPPPPSVTSLMADKTTGGDSDASGKRSALFSDINRGSSVTSGLRHVTKDMQTHKNSALREQAAVKPQSPAKPLVPRVTTGGAAGAAEKPPVCEFRGKKWVVEYQRGNKDLVISQTAMNHTVYMYRCQDSVIQVKGKVNSIIVDSCRKVALVFDSVVASVEFVNSVSCQLQVNALVPTISVDKTDGLQMYLSKESLNTVLVTSKSSEMNVLIPSKIEGDYVELPVAEQFKTVIAGERLVTTVNEST